MCVLTGLWAGKYDQNMRWWSFKPQSGTSKALDSVAYCYVLLTYLACYYSPHLSYHTRSFTHPGLPISILEPPPTAQGYLPTWSSPVSVPSSWLPALLLHIPLASTVWIYLPVVSGSISQKNLLFSSRYFWFWKIKAFFLPSPF